MQVNTKTLVNIGQIIPFFLLSIGSMYCLWHTKKITDMFLIYTNVLLSSFSSLYRFERPKIIFCCHSQQHNYQLPGYTSIYILFVLLNMLIEEIIQSKKYIYINSLISMLKYSWLENTFSSHDLPVFALIFLTYLPESQI
jgi:hypothetical protein